MSKRMISIGVFLLIIIIGFFQKDELLLLIKAGGTGSILVSMLFVAICVFFPLVPFPVLAGVIGAVFGAAQGAIITLSGAMVGTMGFYYLSRYGFRDYAEKKLQQYPNVQKYEEWLIRHSFVAILTCRIFPIMPSPVINIICGISHVNWVIFFTASAIGKIPNILILSFAGASFQQNKLFSFGLYGTYLLVIFLIYIVIIFRRRKTIK